MASIISADTMEKLGRPHVARAWFAVLDLPDKRAFLHSGTGRQVVAGHEYIGVSDPLSGRVVAIAQVEEPRFGQAAAVNLTLTAANVEFIRSVHATAREIEGRPATLSWAAFDGETQELITPLIPLFPRGRMSAPSINWEGIGRRTVSLTTENIWAAQNYAPGGRWSPAGQRERFPGDAGGDFIYVTVSEDWT